MKIIEWFKKRQYISVILVVLLLGIVLAAFGLIHVATIGIAVGILVIMMLISWISNKSGKSKFDSDQ